MNPPTPNDRPGLPAHGRAAAWSVLCLLFLAAGAMAQVDDRAIRSHVRPTVSSIEAETAQLMAMRTELVGEQLAQLEMRIDLRLVARHLLESAAGGQSLEIRSACLLRADQVLRVLSELEGALANNPPAALTESQKGAMKRLNQLSFNLQPIKNAGQVDIIGRTVASVAADVVSATEVDMKQFPAMRPRPIRDSSGNRPSEQRTTLDRLTDEIRVAAIAAPLRRQLLALADATRRTAEDKATAAEAAAMEKVLEDLLTLAKGIETNIGVSSDTRNDIQRQMIEGIALYLDPRTREVGSNRLKALEPYRRLLGRVDEVGLPPEQVEALRPLLAWAYENRQHTDRILRLVQTYGQVTMARDAIRILEPSSIPNLRRPMQELLTRFEELRGTTPLLASRVATLGAGEVSKLEENINELQRIHQVLSALTAMPEVMRTLMAYKPRPAGAIEKRMITSAVTAAGKDKTPDRDAATTFLLRLHRLSDAARALDAVDLKAIPPAVFTRYTGGSSPANVERMWRDIVADQANTIAGGGDIDESRIRQLTQAKDLFDSLPAMAPVEEALSKWDALARWVDWGVNADELRLVLEPYEQATRKAIAGIGTAGNANDFTNWERTRRRYEPLMTLIVRDARYAEACEGMPDDLKGTISQLQTPFDVQQFGTERVATLLIKLWAESVAAGRNADELSQALARRIAQDLRLPYREEPTTQRRQ